REQGYREGDIRGGLSLKFPRSDIDALVHALKEDVKKAHVGLFFSLWVLGYLVNIGFVRLKGSLRVAADKEAKLNNLAMTDELTGILNRRSLMEAYEQSMNLAERKGWPLSVLMLDIDHFKQVNDQHGHQMGDEVLVRFARSVSATLRESDLMGRYGGEEFLIIMQDEDVNGAFSAAERIRKIVQSMSFEGATPFTVQVSIGVAERTQFGDTSPEELLKAADVALYRAKNTGRNRTCMAEAG
ncbi:MAG: GGDEF domain-containing protein, partial [Oceanospirillum sp.]|nr:GGDEF domain-containing protein [Oceanospirillum sp.]